MAFKRRGLLLAVFVFTLQCTLTRCYIFELWSVEQLDDMILSDAFKKSIPARTPAVIGLYETPCKTRLYQEYGFTADGLPNSYAITIAAFDREKASDTWYKWYPEIMDLFLRYNVSSVHEDGSAKPRNDWCPTVLFQPANWSEPVVEFNPATDGIFVDWVWSMLAIPEITFANTLEQSVNLVIRGSGSPAPDIVNELVLAQIAPHASVTLTPDNAMLHAGDVIAAVSDDDRVLNRYLLNTIDARIEIVQSGDANVLDDAKYVQAQRDKVKLRDARDWSTRRRYLNNVRTPPFMPNFTETGFKYLQMPPELCEYVTQFHREQILEGERQRKEGFPKDGTQINAAEIDTWMTHIPPDKKAWIGRVLQPMLEEWSGTPLKYSTIYGMREYRQGAVLKGHCDRVETHIVSAILHVYHDPPDKSWPIEVTSWDGRRYYVEDEPCTMTFYESAKLIHGRPFTYNGTSWVNAFLHYRPADWTGYKFTSDNRLITPTDAVHLVDWVYG